MPTGVRESSREATNRLLGGLRAGRWRPGAWKRFLLAAGERSVEQARTRPRVVAEVSALHGVFLLAARGRPLGGVRWIATSWVLATLHLGMLEDRANLGVANTLTLVRANLPVTATGLARWTSVAALTSDFVDGKVARRTRTTTPFGSYADAIADVAFWTWFASTRGGRAARIAVVLVWLLPVAVVTVRSFRRGAMVEPPRPTVIRPAAVLQVVLAADALRRPQMTRQPGRRGSWLRSCGGRDRSSVRPAT